MLSITDFVRTFTFVVLLQLVVTLYMCSAESSAGLTCDLRTDCESSNHSTSDECLSVPFEELTAHLGNDTQITLCSSNIYTLNRKINFTSLRNISFTSSSTYNTTVVSCTGNAGIIFTECYNVSISNATFEGCGLQLYSGNTLDTESGGNLKLIFQSSIYIINCTDVHFKNVCIANSNGTGLILLDTLGSVDILNCTFDNNTYSSLTNTDDYYFAGGGGVYIELSSERGYTEHHYLAGNKTSMYKIERCLFQRNNASVTNPQIQTPRVRGLGNGMGRGGGLSIAVKNTARDNNISVSGSLFLKNKAVSAGALNIFYQDSTQNNTIEITNSNFSENVACKRSAGQSNCSSERGGGGAYIGYMFFHDKQPRYNKILFRNCLFLENQAKFGGGTAIYSSRSSSNNLENEFEFTNCTWEHNKAQYGSAVTVLPQESCTLKSGFSPTPVFDNCSFVSNYVIAKVQTVTESHYVYTSRGKGAFLVSTFTVQLKRQTLFAENNSSAMYLTSGIIKFAQGSVVNFSRNTGFQGGAIAMFGYSAIYTQDNCSLTFNRNEAVSKGGAIYFQSFDKQNYLHSRSCFIQYEGAKQDVAKRFLSFHFTGNRAMKGCELPTLDTEEAESHNFIGHSIFATTLLPCQNNCSRQNAFNTQKSNSCGLNPIGAHLDQQPAEHNNCRDIQKQFFCFGNFTFGECRTQEVATSGKEFCPLSKNDLQPLKAIPGKETHIPIAIEDDLQQRVWDLHHVSVAPSDSTSQVKVARTHIYSHGKVVKLYGNPGDRAQVTISTTGNREVAVSFEVEMQQCPPGFVMDHGSGNRECVCSAILKNQAYMGIKRCDVLEFRAYISRGVWIGYIESENESENALVSSYCPGDYCLHYRNVGYVSNEYIMPSINMSAKQELDQFICGPNRTGVLCGKCSENYSVYYHSNGDHCELNQNCQWGLLIYIVSELLPVSILFVIVVVFNIPFTSGAVNGVLFFSQFIDTMEISARNFIFTAPRIHEIKRVYRFIYRMFNLNFFTLKQLSFCLWQGARTLDIIAFKYVTITYSLLLVLLTVLIIRACSYSKLLRCCPRQQCRYKSNFRGSIIHGLSAFLVMCYSQCTRASFLILTPGYLHSNEPHDNVVRKVVFHDGEITYLDREHLKYAIPAMFFTAIVILIPPILLITYPLCYRVLALLRIQETRCAKVTCKVLPFERLKPLFDSFQGCFKDEYRFFSGLYFFYRLVALAGFTFSDSLTKFYTILEVLLICMLAVHSVTQPYKLRWHNILDTLLFCNLAVINGLTFYNYKRSRGRRDFQREIDTAAMIQNILIFLPLVYLVVYMAVQIVFKAKRYWDSKHRASEIDEEEEEYNWMLMADNREDVESFETSKMVTVR